MAATILGFSTEIQPQPAFSANRADNGGWTGTHEFAIKADYFSTAISSFQRGTPITTLDPDLNSSFSFLTISEVTVTRVEGDLIFIQTTLTGTSIDQWESGDEPGISTDAVPTYSLRGSVIDRPILEHPKIQELENAYEIDLLSMQLNGDSQCIYNIQRNQFGYWGNDDQTIWYARINPDTLEPYVLSEICATFARIIAKGETTYQVPSITWTETTEGKFGLTPNKLNEIGKISIPRGDPPFASSPRNWLLTSATSDQQGLLYRTQLEWQLSDENGWNTFLYD